jgi:hypothetical protein
MKRIDRLERRELFSDETLYHLTPEDSQPNGRFTRILEVVADEGTNASTISSAAKVIRAALYVAEEAANGFAATEVRGPLGFFADMVKLASLGKSCYEMKQSNKDKLKISSLAIGGITSGLFIFKILNYFEVITLTDLATKIGTIPVIGTTAAKWLPFGNILSILDIAKAGIDIALSHREIKRLKGKISHCHDKRKLWRSIERHGYVRTQYANEKLETMKEKLVVKYQFQKEKSAEIAFKKLEKMAIAVEKQEKLENNPKAPLFRIRNKIAKKKAIKEVKKFLKAANAMESAVAATTKYEEKIATWEKMRDAPREMNEELSQTAAHKIEKWDLKALLHKKGIRHEKRNIAFNVFLITILAASIILTALALTTLSFVGIPLAVALLAIPLISLGMTFYKRYKKRPTYNSVPLPSAL